MSELRQAFEPAFNLIRDEIGDWAKEKGWSEDHPTDSPIKVHYDISKLGLMVTEIAEAIEGRRHGDPASDKIPAFTSQEEELADTIIRIMHYAYDNKLNVASAILAKMEYNKNRPHKHGKQA